jgi:hypothetical protein
MSLAILLVHAAVVPEIFITGVGSFLGAGGTRTRLVAPEQTSEARALRARPSTKGSAGLQEWRERG